MNPAPRKERVMEMIEMSPDRFSNQALKTKQDEVDALREKIQNLTETNQSLLDELARYIQNRRPLN